MRCRILPSACTGSRRNVTRSQDGNYQSVWNATAVLIGKKQSFVADSRHDLPHFHGVSRRYLLQRYRQLICADPGQLLQH